MTQFVMPPRKPVSERTAMSNYIEPRDIHALLALGPMAPVRNPYPLLRELRATQPVLALNPARSIAGSRRAVLVTRYHDVKAVLRDNETFSNDIVQRTVYRMREQVATKLHRLPITYFDGQPRGELLSRVTNDVDNIQQTMQQTFSQLLTSLLTLVGVLGMMV